MKEGGEKGLFDDGGERRERERGRSSLPPPSLSLPPPFLTAHGCQFGPREPLRGSFVLHYFLTGVFGDEGCSVA